MRRYDASPILQNLDIHHEKEEEGSVSESRIPQHNGITCPGGVDN